MCDLHKFVLQALNCGISSVNSYNLVKNNLHLSDSTLFVRNDQYQITGNVVVFGIGKAALGMVKAVVQILQKRISLVICCVPEPITSNDISDANFLKSMGSNTDKNEIFPKVHLFYGSKHNIPNETILEASKFISLQIDHLNSNDLVIICLTGGGSALLCLPKQFKAPDNNYIQLTIEDLICTTQLISKAGASICELNLIRGCLDEFKAGGLAKMTCPAQLVALILSDVIDDQIEFIASGPTYLDVQTPFTSKIQKSIEIIKKYHLWDQIPSNVKLFFTSNHKEAINFFEVESVSKLINNVIIGSNKCALKTIAKYVTHIEPQNVPEIQSHNELVELLDLKSPLDLSQCRRLVPVILTDRLQGFAAHQGEYLAELLWLLINSMLNLVEQSTHSEVCKSSEYQATKSLIEKMLQPGMDSEDKVIEICQNLTAACHKAASIYCDTDLTGPVGVCLLLGGESTVEVYSTATSTKTSGGRCSHLALSAAIKWYELQKKSFSPKANIDMGILAGATDGLDGPEASGGGVWVCGSPEPTISAHQTYNEAIKYLKENNSYEFFKQSNPTNIIPAHLTGTNVMDIIIGLSALKKC